MVSPFSFLNVFCAKNMLQCIGCISLSNQFKLVVNLKMMLSATLSEFKPKFHGFHDKYGVSFLVHSTGHVRPLLCSDIQND